MFRRINDCLCNESCHVKTCLLGLQPGKTQTGLLSYRLASLEIVDLARMGIILSRQLTNALVRLRGCPSWVFVVCIWRKTGFLMTSFQ